MRSWLAVNRARLFGALVTAAVGAPAAVASYRHARTVVERSGDPVMAPWLPLTTDGMLLAALAVTLEQLVAVLVGRSPAPDDAGAAETAVGRPVGPVRYEDTPDTDAELLAELAEHRFWAGDAAEPDPEPTGTDRSALTDEAITAEARDWAVDLGRPPTRHEMLGRFRIGAGRARKLRVALGWADTPTGGPDRSAAAPTDGGETA